MTTTKTTTTTPSTSTKAYKNPLLLPEVLDRVAHFVYSCDEDYWDYHPEVFLPCLLVCRFWHDCFLPHLYSTFISGQTDDGSPYHPHTHHLRTFVMFRPVPDKELPYKVEDASRTTPPGQLTTLRVHQNAEAMLDLLSANAGSSLRVLTWTASKFLVEMPPAMIKSMTMLSGLVSLELDSWKIDRADLLAILAACSSTLEMLSLRLISGYGESPFLPLGSSFDLTPASAVTPTRDLSMSMSSLSILPSQPPRMKRLSELRLVLDWHQSPAAVHLVQLCPALKSLYLNVDVETSDWSALISNLRTFCPRLESIEYEVGYSMEYETGCYIESSLYASLLRDSTVEGESQLRRVVLGVKLDELITEALLKHSETLEEMNLEVKDFGPEEVRMVGRLLAGCQRLKEVDIEDVGKRCEAKDLEELTREVWMCRDLTSLTISGYSPGEVKEESLTAKGRKENKFREAKVTREQGEIEDMLKVFSESGQGWYVRPSLREKEVEEAVEDMDMKRRLMIHMMESGLEQVERVQFNESKFYSDEKYFTDDEEEEDEEEEEEEEEGEEDE
ncbi:hypothetical protein F5H01DRAFT_352341 [Linnemannia elongata]|nr:hypothetical protein F5H01DRAFT_352341 [Linnemannia elongata]